MCPSPLCSYYNSIPQCSVVLLQFSLVLSRCLSLKGFRHIYRFNLAFLIFFLFKNSIPYVTISVCLLNQVAKILYMLCFGCKYWCNGVNILSADGYLVSHCLSPTAFPLCPCSAATFYKYFLLSSLCCHFPAYPITPPLPPMLHLLLFQSLPVSLLQLRCDHTSTQESD